MKTLAVAAVALAFAGAAEAATTSQLAHRQARQRSTISRDRGTLRFFRRRPRLARTVAGRRAVRFARAELAWTARELAETRAALAPKIDPLAADFACIHRYEGSWSANTGNGYYGGLQMDLGFQRSYGSDYLSRYGTADAWPASAQLAVAERAYRAGRGFWPWPNSARLCGLL